FDSFGILGKVVPARVPGDSPVNRTAAQFDLEKTISTVDPLALTLFALVDQHDGYHSAFTLRAPPHLDRRRTVEHVDLGGALGAGRSRRQAQCRQTCKLDPAPLPHPVPDLLVTPQLQFHLDDRPSRGDEADAD